LFLPKDGRPFFWFRDVAWNLFQRLNREETERYLENRSLKGFNAIQAVAFNGSGEKNAYGSEALLENNAGRPNVTAGNDFLKPGEYDYWDHIDWVADLAAKKGLYVAVVPVRGSSVKTKTLNLGNIETYARGWPRGIRTNQMCFRSAEGTSAAISALKSGKSWALC
jgi:hypothetical protein